MKSKLFYVVFIISLAVLGLIWLHSDSFAQETPAEEIPFIDRDGDGVNDFLQRGWGLRFNRMKKMREKIMEGLKPEMVDTDDDGVADTPYIDTDGDGEVDTPLHEYLEATREERRAENNGRFHPVMVDTDDDGEVDTPYIDTDADGEADTPLHEFMQAIKEERKAQYQARMQELVDTDNDGVPDTPLYQHLRSQFGTFDRDGDGKPDPATLEEIRQHMQEMMQWRKQVHEKLKQGENPFLDEDGDGIPDGLPEHMKRMRGRYWSNPDNNGSNQYNK